MRPLVISHRTEMGRRPENTVAGIEAALEAGADGVEFDLRATADGELVLMHDDSLLRTTESPHLLADLTLGEVTELRVQDSTGSVGEQPIPTFRHVLDHVAGRALLAVELKEPGLERRVAELIREADAADWCWIWSFDSAVVARSRAELPEVPAWFSYNEPSQQQLGEDPLEIAVRLGASGVSVGHALATEELTEQARRRGLRVATWTVNESADLARVRAAGVDAICGDFPDRIFAALG